MTFTPKVPRQATQNDGNQSKYKIQLIKNTFPFLIKMLLLSFWGKLFFKTFVKYGDLVKTMSFAIQMRHKHQNQIAIKKQATIFKVLLIEKISFQSIIKLRKWKLTGVCLLRHGLHWIT